MRPFTAEWLKAAHDDLLTVCELVSNPQLTHIAAFHSQQCVEKVMKAVLEEYEMDMPKIHSLIKLGKMLPIRVKGIDDIELSRLDELYIDSRYPGEMGLLPHGKPTLEDAKAFYTHANAIFHEVCSLLDIGMDEIISP